MTRQFTKRRQLTKHRESGSIMLEFALTGVPMIFMWISIVQMALGMWNYDVLQNAVKVTGNYISVHGATCAATGNSCTIKVSNVISTFQTYAIGIPAAAVSLTLTSNGGTTVTCAPITTCSSSITTWPPASDNAVGEGYQDPRRLHLSHGTRDGRPGGQRRRSQVRHQRRPGSLRFPGLHAPANPVLGSKCVASERPRTAHWRL